MFEVPQTMLTIDNRGLVFAGRHVLAPLCPLTGRFNKEADLHSALVRLTVGYRTRLDARVTSLLKSAVDAWNGGDHGRAAYDLILTQLPDPKGDTGFYERLDLVDKALAAGHTPDEILKTFGGSLAWIGEARIPAGQSNGGQWTNGNGGSGDSGSVTDIAARPKDLCNNREAVQFVKKYYPEAAAVGAEYGVPGEYIIGLAARETKYGIQKAPS